MTTAPAVMSRPPTMAEALSFSPSSSHAKTMTSGTTGGRTLSSLTPRPTRVAVRSGSLRYGARAFSMLFISFALPMN